MPLGGCPVGRPWDQSKCACIACPQTPCALGQFWNPLLCRCQCPQVLRCNIGPYDTSTCKCLVFNAYPIV